MSSLFDTILIANRGEIACRIIRTARVLGIRTIAVYSDADADAMHVALADQAIAIGPAPARESYLSATSILAAARQSGAQAIHPGYGFLSENPDFADACAAAGIVFIGPPASAMRAMGSKSAAKSLMQNFAVPLVPGYHGDDQSIATLTAEAHKIGLPLLVKASAGGGGKGMRIVERYEDFADAITQAKNEALASFGDDHVLIERFLSRPRHIEIQVFADTHGQVVSLFERDCSIQRRYQKIIEEAPAPFITPERRHAMGEAACRAARAVDYVGAGTVEFIVEGDAFYFMEMNTRLQVEHPVTEMITGLDLVEWQLRIAAGQPLPLTADQLSITGHALEVRIYAEDPQRDFAPSIGRLRHFHPPEASHHVRLDSGVRQGDDISIHYDPMIAKLITWGETRADALRHLAGALADFEILGVHSNIELLRRIIAHEAFAAGHFDTGFIAQHAALLHEDRSTIPDHALCAAIAYKLATQTKFADPADPYSPWAAHSLWRISSPAYQDFWARMGDSPQRLRAIVQSPDAFTLEHEGEVHQVRYSLDDNHLHLSVNGLQQSARIIGDQNMVDIFIAGHHHKLELVDPLAPPPQKAARAGLVLAPMPGKILEIAVQAGDNVAENAVLLVMEAMKMQMRVTAPAAGIVAQIACAVGDLVDDGAELVRLEPPTP
jgi:3-methylcrotonyl-CoA carboxylase alpha subunit